MELFSLDLPSQERDKEWKKASHKSGICQRNQRCSWANLTESYQMTFGLNSSEQFNWALINDNGNIISERRFGSRTQSTWIVQMVFANWFEYIQATECLSNQFFNPYIERACSKLKCAWVCLRSYWDAFNWKILLLADWYYVTLNSEQWTNSKTKTNPR